MFIFAAAMLLTLAASVESGSYQGQKEISEMNLLLPVSVCSGGHECRSPKYELFASNGCYSWEISHPHMIKMTPAKTRGDCVDSVILEPLLNRESKNLIQIRAKDKSSGQVLESLAKIGQIDHLAINTQYRFLYINDKKHIDVVAYDDQGNLFSGLEGFRFDWTVKSGSQHLKFIKKPEGYHQTKSADGTELQYVKGLTQGQAELNVRLLEPGYEHIESVDVKILVVSPFVIAPQREIFLLPTSQFNYDLIRLSKQDNGDMRKEPIKIPDSQYQWSVQDAEVGKINQKGNFIAGPTEGTQNVQVVDQKMVNNTAEVQLQVVEAYTLQMDIYDVTEQGEKTGDDLASQYGIEAGRPSGSRILVENRIYLIRLTLEDKDGNSITLTDNIKLENLNLLDQPWIHKLQVNDIGSQILFKTKEIDTDLKKMQTSYSLKEVLSLFQGHVHIPKHKARLTVDAELILTKPVKITHPTDLILLPFQGSSAPQIWHTSAIGGSGIYSWTIEDPTIASVEDSATIKGLNLGKTKLIVQDHRNLKNKATVSVEVAQINQLKWLEEQMELRASDKDQGEVATLSVIALDRQGRKFTNCTEVDFSFITKGDGNVNLMKQNEKSYESLVAYVSESEDLITLRQRFDENPSKVYLNELPQVQQSQLLMTYNNFGICEQAQIKAGSEGLGRVRAQYIPSVDEGTKVIESEFAEIAVYKQLQTSAPDVASLFTDLYSQTQVGQEFQTLDHLFTPNVLTLVGGSSISWAVSGGTNFWKDYSDSYNVEWKVTPADSNCLQIEKEFEKTTEFDIRINCQPSDLTKINKVSVTMLQNSKQSRQLLRPAQHEVSIQVECGAPKSTRLLWSQHFKTVEESLPNSRMQQNERIHYALAGSKHFVKTLMMDSDQMAYLNTSSVVTAVTSSDQQLATVSLPQQGLMEALEQDTYAKRQVQFSDSTGTVTLKSEASAYVSSLLPEKSRAVAGWGGSVAQDTSDWKLGELTGLQSTLTDTLKIQVIKKLHVEPKFKSLYLGSQNAFKMNIMEGSGHFSVSQNSTSVADLVHKEREIWITPKSEGMLEIYIEDVELPGSEPTKAQVLISDIDKLYLWSPRSLIEQGDQMNLIVSALDSQGNDFDEDQYVDMRFSIETEMTGVISRQHGLKTVATSLNTEFKAIGKEPGIYQLTAFTRRAPASQSHLSMNIVSDMIRVEVFPLLEIYPSELLITPNMKYTLQIVGGPQTSVQSFQNGSSIEINFDIEQKDIATVDNNREVTGLQVGDASLRYQIIQQRTPKSFVPRGVKVQDVQGDHRVVSKHFVPIRVRLVTDIEIPLADHRQIYSESLVKFNAVLKYGHEYFNHGVAPISYSWDSSSSRVLSLEVPADNLMTASGFIQKSRKLRNNEKRDDNALFSSSFNTSSIYCTAGKEGDAQIQVNLAIEYPDTYRNDKNWFATAATVKVASQMAIKVNQYSSASSQATHMYLIPPNTIGHIQTTIDSKLKLGYSTVSVYDHSTDSFRSEETTNPIVKLLDNKAIQTFDKYGKVTVVVEQGGQSFSDQVAMLNVFIADIYSIQVMNTYDVLNLPLGSSFKLPIHFQNEHANRFADNVEGIKIGYSLSHPKVVQVQIDHMTQTLTILSQGSGDCNILIYLESNPQVFDVIKVKVSSIVRPLSPVYLHIGGEVEFRVINPDEKSASLQDEKQFWKSSEPQVLQISNQDGKASGKQEGRAEVMLSNHINAASIVHVGRVKEGQIQHQRDLVLNTDQPDDLRVKVKLYLNKGEEVMPTVQYDGVTLIRQNVGILCASDQPDFIEASSEVSDLEGYLCLLRYKQDANHKSMPRYVKVTVNAFGLLPNTNTPIYSDQVAQFEVQLLSSIKVQSEFKKGLTLSKERRTQAVQIFSSSDFDIKIEYQDGADSWEQPAELKYQWTRPEVNSNQYNLTMMVPSEVTKAFKANVVMTHPYTKFQRVLPVSFTVDSKAASAPLKASQPPPQQNTVKQSAEPEYENMRSSRPDSSDQSGGSWTSYMAVFIVGAAGIAFVLYNWTNFFNNNEQQQRGNDQRIRPSRNRPMEMNYQAHDLGVREPQRSFPRKNYNYGASHTSVNNSAFSQVNQSMSGMPQRRQMPAGQGGVNLDNFSAQRPQQQDRSGGDPSRISLYSNSLDRSGF